MSLLTVGIPTYKNIQFLDRAIQSVLSQSLKDLELYVFDDNSPEDLESIVEKYKNIRNFHFVKHSTNLGAAANWDACLRAGEGKYVAMLHQDDAWGVDHALDMVDLLESNKISVLSYCPCYWINEKDELLALMMHPGHKKTKYIGGRNEFAELLVYDCYITMSAAVFRREIIEKVGKFKKCLSMDWEYFIRIASANSNFCFTPTPSVYYRKHAGQDSSRFYSTEEPLVGHVTLLQDVLQYYGKEKMVGYESSIWNLLVGRLNNYTEAGYGLTPMVNEIGRLLERLRV